MNDKKRDKMTEKCGTINLKSFFPIHCLTEESLKSWSEKHLLSHWRSTLIYQEQNLSNIL